jgi:RHS repeat-associated protein
MGFSAQKFFPEHHPKAALSPQVWHEKTASRKFFDQTKIVSEKSPAKPTTAREKSDRTYETAPEVIYEHYRYTAFGEPEIYDSSGNKLTASAIKNEILWNSRRYDSTTNLYYYKYRHYKAEYGRWTSTDPIEEDGGVNLYGFVGNEPINEFDMYGLIRQYKYCQYGKGPLGGCCITPNCRNEKPNDGCEDYDPYRVYEDEGDETVFVGGEENKKIKTLNIIIRRDSSFTKENFDKKFFETQHIRVLKKVLESCDKQFSVGKIEVVHRFELDNQVLDGKEGYGKGEQQLKNFHAAGNSQSPNIYVLGTKYPLIGPDGSLDAEGIAMPNSAVVMIPRSPGYTLAHEIGHVIGYDGGDLDNGVHSSGADNLMGQQGGNTPDKNWCTKMINFLK